jgi:hypothetical protein
VLYNGIACWEEREATVDSACHPTDVVNPHAHPIVIMGTIPIRTVTLFGG